MTRAALEVVVELTQFSCGVCGGVYAINERVREHHEKKGTCWNCPYCRISWGYPGDSEVALLKKQISQKDAALRDEAERHARTLARLNEEATQRKSLATKLKRVDAGVCPECNRTFMYLARHMKCKHSSTPPLDARVGATPLP